MSNYLCVISFQLMFYKTLSYRLAKALELKATITRCDLLSRFFCIDATSLCEFESDKMSQQVWIESQPINRIM